MIAKNILYGSIKFIQIEKTFKIAFKNKLDIVTISIVLSSWNKPP